MNKEEDPKLHPGANYQALPLLGAVMCGLPGLAIECLEDLIVVPGQILGTIESAFLLRVKGDAMSGEGILPRDIVIVAPSAVANDGELVIALLGEDALLGRLRKTKDAIFMYPSNPAYSPIEVCREDSTIVGRVIGLIRSFDDAFQ